tara:strand:+ start:1562 stop:2179 length:618 start_codon:yes stop_codon:yes gene_type:complete
MLALDKISLGPVPVDLNESASPSFIGSWMMGDTSVCDDLITLFDNSDQKYTGEVTVRKGQAVKKEVKDSKDLKLTGLEVESQNYVTQLQTCLDCYLEQYKQANSVTRFEIEAVNMQKYPLGGGFKVWHSERGSVQKAFRNLVFMTYLNDVEDGGETEFMYQNLKVKPRKGLTLIWPPDWMYTHRGVPSLTEEKYIVTGWYHYSRN